MLLLFRLGSKLQIDVVGEFREVSETFLSTANAVSRETYEKKKQARHHMNICFLSSKSLSTQTLSTCLVNRDLLSEMNTHFRSYPAERSVSIATNHYRG